jgi:histidinol-phosphate aminotransferase
MEQGHGFVADASRGLSRRGFLSSALLGGVGVAAFAGLSPEAMARALIEGKTAADIKGMGVRPGIVDLDQNENPLGPSPLAIEAVKAHLHELNRYMNDFPVEMYMKLNMMSGVSFEGLNLQNPTREDMREAQHRNRVSMAPGSTELLRALTLFALEKGGQAIEAEGGYGDIARYTQSLQQRGRNATLTRVPLTQEKRHDLKAMQKAVTAETKLVVITNPNNPTGTIVPYEEIGWFIDNVPPSVLVIVDEAYIDFVKDPNYKNAAAYAIAKPNVVVTRTFSKIYGLAGVRMGYALGHPETLDGLWLYTGWMMPTLSIYAAAAALNDAEHIRTSRETILAGREYLSAELTKMGTPFTPSEANFLIIDVGKDPESIIRYLYGKNVMVRNAGNWGIKNHLRVSIGTPDELEVFISTFKEALANAGA